MRALLIIAGLIVFISVGALSVFLLSSGLLSGGEFSAIFIAFAIISLIIPLLPEVQNFSIAGNSVTFKEVKQEAKNAISELKKAQIDTMRLLLFSIFQSGGIKVLESVFSESKSFWVVYGKITHYGYDSELSPEITDALKLLMHSYINLFVHSSDKFKSYYSDKENELLSPTRVKELIIGEENLKHKDFAISGLSEYEKLYELNNVLGKKI